jgi:hypothetical protein
VNWYVYATSFKIRTDQLSQIKGLSNQNFKTNREVQEINDRKIYLIDINCNSLMEFNTLGIQKNEYFLKLILGLLLIVVMIG